jgi:sucrose-6F-phosphate phosphohydrolase
MRLLLCTDLDRTLVPNGPQPESPGARRRFAQLVAQPGVVLAFVTGRHRALVEQAIGEWQLPPPDYVVADVGTTLWHCEPGAGWQRDQAWEQTIAADWRGHTAAQLADYCQNIEGLTLQAAERQNRHKLSFTFASDADTGWLAGQVEARLESLGIAKRLVFSVDEVRREGLLDVLPRSASKRHAIEALAQRLGINLEQILFCGDSGNDLEVLTSAIPSVLVANASDAVRRAASDGAQARGHAQQLYLARGGALGMNGHYAAGILEGLLHFHPWAQALLEEGR